MMDEIRPEILEIRLIVEVWTLQNRKWKIFDTICLSLVLRLYGICGQVGRRDVASGGGETRTFQNFARRRTDHKMNSGIITTGENKFQKVDKIILR
jgi:hypothetical protein